MKSPLNYIRHIQSEALYLHKESRNISRDIFLNNETLKRAFIRSIEIIGEATKNIDSEFKQKYSKLDWKKMAGMRDRLIHAYFDVDYFIVWDIVINKIPDLLKRIEEIIEKEEKDRPNRDI